MWTMPSRSDAIVFPPGVSAATPADKVAGVGTGIWAARGWFLLAVGSLVLAGLLSLLLVVGRLPFLGWLFTDPMFFRRALVVHVDLSIVVWFQAGALAFLGLALGGRLPRFLTRAALVLAGTGVALILAGALQPGAQPVLSNYVPAIDHPVFYAGLVCWFTGAGLFFAGALFAPRSTGDADVLPAATVVALRAAAAANLLALATFAGAWRTTPAAAPAVYCELLFWGGGHVLQAANVAAMLGLWLYLFERWTGRALLSTGAVAVLLTALVLPQAVLPMLAWQGTTETAYFPMATQLMRWTLFPVVLVVLAVAVRQAWRLRAELDWRDHRAAGLLGSAGLTVLGFVLGAMIRGSNTLVPGHYHCAIGAVTLALMAAAYDLSAALAPAAVVPERPRRARLQLILFGAGQAVFGLGFALAGAFGLGRKQYGAEQHVRSLGEYLGLGVMGLGGLIAVAGGILFLAVMLRRLAAWRRETTSLEPIDHEQRTRSQNPPVAETAG